MSKREIKEYILNNKGNKNITKQWYINNKGM
jgi:hypothetical protein